MPPRSALAKRKFTINSSPAPDPSPSLTRKLKRVSIAAEILKAAKICAGDAIVVRAWEPEQVEEGETGLEKGLEGVSLEESRAKFAVGIAWPSYTLSGTAIEVSPLLLANAGLAPNSIASISALADSGIDIIEAHKLVLIHDGKGASNTLFESSVRELVYDLKFVAAHNFVEVFHNGRIRRLVVSAVRGAPLPKGSPSPDQTKTIYEVLKSSTQITFKPPIAPLPKRKVPLASGSKAAPVAVAEGGELAGYESVGGMDAQIKQIRELVEWPLTRPELYKHFGLRPPKGVLLYGPPGTGKTLLAAAIAKSTGSTLFTINGPQLSSAYHGETEKALRDIFMDAKRQSPSIIVIDEIDALAPNREDGGEVERRVVAQLLTLMDGLEEKADESKAEDADEEGSEDEEEGDEEVKEKEPPRVVVIAATNRPNAIDPALRRPGRFDKELEIGVPDATARLSILSVLLMRTPHDISPAFLKSVADQTHGFVGADLSSLVHTAGTEALKRAFAHMSQTPGGSIAGMKLSEADFEPALLETRPSAMREVFLETPKVLWSDIGGQEQVKARLKESVEWPLLHPEDFTRLGVQPPKGILLYGPPGCSKTLIAKALATEGGLNFIAIKGPEIFSKYVGESEKAIREIFRKARAAAPSIVFLDEIDALAPARGSDEGGGATSDRVLISLLTEMDGMQELKGVIVVAATNRPDVIDPALMRPGRLDRILYVAPPDEEARRAIFKINIGKMGVAEDVKDRIDELVALTDGCSGAEIASICQDAGMKALGENKKISGVRHEHFVLAAREVRRRITPEMRVAYEEWEKSSGVTSINLSSKAA